MDALALALAAAYAFMQLRWRGVWLATPDVKPPADADGVAWSVVIAARDEAAQLGGGGVLAQLGPGRQYGFALGGKTGELAAGRYEVILVDDHSADATKHLARGQEHVRVLASPAGQIGKQAALTRGIASARGAWVATLDADVAVGPDWLAGLDSTRRGAPGARAVAGPVALGHDGSWWQRWQALDFCGMMAITAASLRGGRFAMGNGANLAFAKTAFAKVDGYAVPAGARAAASGDDMLLLGKLLEQFGPGSVAFAKTRGAVAETPAMPDVAAFVRQRLRWSAKTTLNRQPALTATLGVTWAFHVGLLVGPCVLLAQAALGASGPLSAWAVAVAWAVKLVVDLALLRAATAWFARRDLLDASYPLQSLAHAVYVAGVGTLALLPLDFAWKGRRHRV